MEKSKVRVFTTVTCPHCPGAKRMVKEVVKKRNDAVVLEHSNATAAGMKIMNQYGIQTVPTVMVSGPGFHKTLVVDPLTEGNLVGAIEITQGKRIPKQEKSFFEKVKEKFSA